MHSRSLRYDDQLLERDDRGGNLDHEIRKRGGFGGERGGGVGG